MYKFMQLIIKDKYSSLASALMYICSPYFLSDVFKRLSLAEVMMFLFVPIVMISIYYMVNKNYKKFFIYFVIGYVGMINSHLVLTVYFTFALAIVFLFYMIKKVLDKKSVLYFSIATILVLGLTATFSMPMLEHKILGDYTVFNTDSMTNLGWLKNTRLHLRKVFWINVNEDVLYHISPIVTILFIVSIFSYKKLNSEEKKVYISVALFTVMSFFIGSILIDVSKIPKLLWSIQFYWRLMLFITFGLCILAGTGLLYFKSIKLKQIIICIICIVGILDYVIIMNHRDYKTAYEYTSQEISKKYFGTLGWQKEYLPISTVNNFKYLKIRSQEVEIIDGQVNELTIIENKTPTLKFKVELNEKQNVKLEIPRIFYFGYTIKIITDNREEQQIKYYENKNGFIEFELDKSGVVEVEYTGDIVNYIARGISIFSVIIFVVILLYFDNKEKI